MWAVCSIALEKLLIRQEQCSAETRTGTVLVQNEHKYNTM